MERCKSLGVVRGPSRKGLVQLLTSKTAEQMIQPPAASTNVHIQMEHEQAAATAAHGAASKAEIETTVPEPQQQQAAPSQQRQPHQAASNLQLHHDQQHVPQQQLGLPDVLRQPLQQTVILERQQRPQQQQHQQPQGEPALSRRPPRHVANSEQQRQEQQQHGLLASPEQLLHGQPVLHDQLDDPWDRYLAEQPTGVLALFHLLCCPLWSVPRPLPVKVEHENRVFDFYPSSVVYRPDYFNDEMHNYAAQQADKQQLICRAPDYSDEQKFTSLPENEQVVMNFLFPVTSTLHAILLSLGRQDKYVPLSSVGARVAGGLLPPGDGTGMPGVPSSTAAEAAAVAAVAAGAGACNIAASAAAPPAAAVAADSPAAVAAEALTALQEAVAGSLQSAVAAAASSQAVAATVLSARQSSRESSSRRTADFIMRQVERDRRSGERITSVPSIPGSQELSSYLDDHPQLQSDQQQRQQQQPGGGEHHVLQREQQHVGGGEQHLLQAEPQQQWQQQQQQQGIGEQHVLQPQQQQPGGGAQHVSQQLRQQQQQQGQQPSERLGSQPQVTHVHVQPAEGRPVLFVVVKKAEKLLDATGTPLKLADLYPGDLHVRSLFGEVFTSMVKYKVRTAILTCHEVLWVLDRHDKALDTIYISEPIPATNKGPEQHTQLLAMAWAQHKALLQLAVPLSGPDIDTEDSDQQGWSSEDSIGDDDSNKDDASRSRDDEPCRDSKRQRVEPQRDPGQVVHQQQHVQSQQQQQHQQQQQPKVTVLQQLKALAKLEASLPVVPGSALGLYQGAEVLGEGGTAVVLKGSFGGRDAAIKMVAWQAPTLLREAAMYIHVRRIQGLVVPEVLAIGKLAAGAQDISFLALSHVPGTCLSAVSITPDVAAAAVSAVQQLHSCGVVHGDLVLNNMMLLHQQHSSSSSTGQQQPSRVMLVDLESARQASTSECKLELHWLQSKLAARVSAGQSIGC